MAGLVPPYGHGTGGDLFSHDPREDQVQLNLHMSTYHKIFGAYQIDKIRLRFS